MGMLDFLDNKDAKQIKHYDIAQEEAMKMFNKQRNSILALKGTKGLEIILDYWKSVMDINEDMFENAKLEDKDKYFALRKQAKNFLTFIENLTDK